MRLRLACAALALALAALFATAAPAAGPNWLTTVTLTPEGSHILGNVKAPLRVTAWVSYTCPHCAAFERESDAPLRIDYLARGRVSYEIKHILRDPVDATVAQLANCGPKEKFFGNTTLFFRKQAEWIGPLASASAGQRARWTTGDYASRRRAIAADFHLFELMEQRGYTRADANRCLADEALAKRIAAQTAEAEKLGFEGTPSFSLNGEPLFGTNTWLALQAQLRARL